MEEEQNKVSRPYCCVDRQLTFHCFDNDRDSPFRIILSVAKVTLIQDSKHSYGTEYDGPTLYAKFQHNLGHLLYTYTHTCILYTVYYHAKYTHHLV